MGRLVLVLGGARSGKSRFAQDLALRGAGPEVLFVATAEPLDEEMRRRIARHRLDRPHGWRTLEAPLNVGRRMRPEIADAGYVIIDCLTLLTSNVIGTCGDPDRMDAVLASQKMESETTEILSCIRETCPTFVVVTNEVGLGLVPDNRLGRIYRDCLGQANRELARSADAVYFMAAGIPMAIKGGL